MSFSYSEAQKNILKVTNYKKIAFIHQHTEIIMKMNIKWSVTANIKIYKIKD